MLKNIFTQRPLLSLEVRNSILLQIADTIKNSHAEIQKANNKDQEQIKLNKYKNVSKSMLQRLQLNKWKIQQLSHYAEEIQKLPEPVGIIQKETELDTDLILQKVSCPIGLIGVIFESRPEVIIQIASLAIKTNNLLLLKGGSECIYTNKILLKCIKNILKKYQLEYLINMVFTREEVLDMLSLENDIDLIIARGGKDLINFVRSQTYIPVLGHADGICHIYTDKEANINMAIQIITDAKIDYPAACNSVETVLLHQDIAFNILLPLIESLISLSVEIRLSSALFRFAKEKGYSCKLADEKDWTTEYNDLILSIKTVQSLEEAIEHINFYGSHHTESIITENPIVANDFVTKVDSACVFHNASTRFSDGNVFGFGAEIGISTSKISARGPVGLEGMTSYKYSLKGKGHIKGTYAGENAKKFTHRHLA